MELNARIPPARSRRMGPAPLRDEARQPGEQAEINIIVVGSGLAAGLLQRVWASSATT